jgi:hypothetical protein
MKMTRIRILIKKRKIIISEDMCLEKRREEQPRWLYFRSVGIFLLFLYLIEQIAKEVFQLYISF